MSSDTLTKGVDGEGAGHVADLMALSCCPASRSCTIPFTSPPAQKALPPAPFRMIACTSGLVSQSLYSRCRVSHMA